MKPKTIFEIDSKLFPVNIYIVPYDNTIKPLNGYIEKNIESVKDFLEESGASLEVVLDERINTNGILVISDNKAYVISNLVNSVAFTIDNLFICMYNNEILRSRISNN